jgi:hypothetical protein
MLALGYVRRRLQVGDSDGTGSRKTPMMVNLYLIK